MQLVFTCMKLYSDILFYVFVNGLIISLCDLNNNMECCLDKASNSRNEEYNQWFI